MEVSMASRTLLKPVRAGVVAGLTLLAAYFLILTLVSGWNFAWTQFSDFWYFVVALAVGFGVQIGLYSYLKRVTRHPDASGKVAAVSGATSTGAMISCCTHYLANVLPVLGATGVVALVAQYQVQLFWVGLAFNLAGVLYIGRKAFEASRHMALMEAHG
jgi:Cu+-exporting ATPase